MFHRNIHFGYMSVPLFVFLFFYNFGCVEEIFFAALLPISILFSTTVHFFVLWDLKCCNYFH